MVWYYDQFFLFFFAIPSAATNESRTSDISVVKIGHDIHVKYMTYTKYLYTSFFLAELGYLSVNLN